ncbi:MAG: ParB/RepB/Spo0J family partition protein [Paludibacteraceae bacterium]
MAKKSPLGRGFGGGLGALLEDVTTDAQPQGGSSINEIELDKIEANPGQPRTNFDEEALAELAESLRTIGVISPITLRKIDDDHYQIIAGERRWRAAKLAGLDKIPAYIKTADDEQQVQLMALIENIQREDLNAIEIALSYNKLMTEYNLTQEALSQQVGKKRATVANYVRLLKLPAEIQLGLKDNKIDMGHARVLAGIENTADQLAVYERIISEKLSVRATEELVQESPEIKSGTKKKNTTPTNTHTELNEHLSRLLGCKTQVSSVENGSGKLTVKFGSQDELNALVEKLEILAK